MVCLLKQAEVCSDRPSSRLSPLAWFGLHAAWSFQGILFFLIWGTNRENYALWKALFVKRCSSNVPRPSRTRHGEEGKQGKESRDTIHEPDRTEINDEVDLDLVPALPSPSIQYMQLSQFTQQSTPSSSPPTSEIQTPEPKTEGIVEMKSFDFRRSTNVSTIDKLEESSLHFQNPPSIIRDLSMTRQSEFTDDSNRKTIDHGGA